MKGVVEKIVNEIKKIHQGEFSVSYREIVNYVLGQGDLAFNFQNKPGFFRGELIGDLTEQELNHSVARKDIIGKVVLSAKEQYQILAQARQGKVLIIDANGMVNVQSFPNSWSIFKPEYNHEFYKKLIEFRGNDLDLGWGKLGGGVSRYFHQVFENHLQVSFFSSPVFGHKAFLSHFSF